jgi:CheY-like chemotaxis protein
MPGGTGIEALKRLKSSLNTALIPVIILSGSTDAGMQEKLKTLGPACSLRARPDHRMGIWTPPATVLPLPLPRGAGRKGKVP